MLKGMAASPINAIVIPPDGEWTLGVIEQDLRTLQGIVGGYLEAVNTMYDEGGYPRLFFAHHWPSQPLISLTAFHSP